MKSEKHNWQGETRVCVCVCMCLQVCVSVCACAAQCRQTEGRSRLSLSSLSLPQTFELSRSPQCVVTVEIVRATSRPVQLETTEKQRCDFPSTPPPKKKKRVVNQSHLSPLYERGTVPEALPMPADITRRRPQTADPL